MSSKTFDAAHALAQHTDISVEQIDLALRIIGYRNHTPGLQTILRRAQTLAERFEALRAPCPGLSEVIDCFILAGRIAEFASRDMGAHGNNLSFINASQDEVFNLRDQELGELEKDLFAICWMMKAVALIRPVHSIISLRTSNLVYTLQTQLLLDEDEDEGSAPALIHSLHPSPFWDRLQHLCTCFSGEEHGDCHFPKLREALAELSTLHLAGLTSPHIQLNDAVQLPLTERALSSAHWHFPRPADLESLRSLLTESNLEESSPTRTESLIILTALTTGRDINQTLTIMVSGLSDFPDSIGSQQRLALRKRGGSYGRPVYAEWHIPIRGSRPLVLPLPERLSVT